VPPRAALPASIPMQRSPARPQPAARAARSLVPRARQLRAGRLAGPAHGTPPRWQRDLPEREQLCPGRHKELGPGAPTTRAARRRARRRARSQLRLHPCPNPTSTLPPAHERACKFRERLLLGHQAAAAVRERARAARHVAVRRLQRLEVCLRGAHLRATHPRMGGPGAGSAPRVLNACHARRQVSGTDHQRGPRISVAGQRLPRRRTRLRDGMGCVSCTEALARRRRFSVRARHVVRAAPP